MLKTSTKVEQAAEYLRGELRKSRWTERMPGRRVLTSEMGISHNTVQRALEQLEAEGLLVSEGSGKRRRICLGQAIQPKSLRIGILLYDKRELPQFENRNVRNLLESAGHTVDYGERDLQYLRMDPERVAKFVRSQPADAWVVNAGTPRVLEWFADQPLPAFALFGTKAGLPMAGASPRKVPALTEAVRHLIGLGHRRIVMLVREDRRKPQPNGYEQAFLDELGRAGIRTGGYNLPDWGDSPEELHRGLEALFQYTPPTALIISEPKLFFAVRDHLAQRGVVAPRDVSLICEDPDPNFTWCRPEVAHITWSQRTIVRRVVRWAENVARGRKDVRQTFAKASYVHGGTVGPARKEEAK